MEMRSNLLDHGSNPVKRAISGVHNGFQLWTLEFFIRVYVLAEDVPLPFFCYAVALSVKYSTATPLRVPAVK